MSNRNAFSRFVGGWLSAVPEISESVTTSNLFSNDWVSGISTYLGPTVSENDKLNVVPSSPLPTPTKRSSSFSSWFKFTSSRTPTPARSPSPSPSTSSTSSTESESSSSTSVPELELPPADQPSPPAQTGSPSRPRTRPRSNTNRHLYQDNQDSTSRGRSTRGVKNPPPFVDRTNVTTDNEIPNRFDDDGEEYIDENGIPIISRRSSRPVELVRNSSVHPPRLDRRLSDSSEESMSTLKIKKSKRRSSFEDSTPNALSIIHKSAKFREFRVIMFELGIGEGSGNRNFVEGGKPKPGPSPLRNGFKIEDDELIDEEDYVLPTVPPPKKRSNSNTSITSDSSLRSIRRASKRMQSLHPEPLSRQNSRLLLLLSTSSARLDRYRTSSVQRKQDISKQVHKVNKIEQMIIKCQDDIIKNVWDKEGKRVIKEIVRLEKVKEHTELYWKESEDDWACWMRLARRLDIWKP